MEAAPSRAPLAAEKASGRSNPLLRLASDERLVARVRAGSEPAFTELYERYYRRILSFCRHMLGSPEEGEDAVQQTFINAYRDMVRSDKELRFRPWLYRIARNQSLSMLRARRQEAELSDAQPSLVGLSEEVAGRGDLRDLLHDLRQLSTDQREALVLAELHDNSHVEVAEIIGCDKEKVKSLVFQARTSLIKSREAREVSCEEIRQQLGILRGGSLRRNVIRRHLKGCEGCRAFQREVKRQRQALAIILPVIPSAALKFGAGTAMAAVGAKAAGAVGGAAAGGAAAGGVAAGGASAAGTAAGGAAASGPFAAVAAKLGVSAVAVKGAAATATVTAVVAGGTVGENVTRDLVRDSKPAASRSSGKGGEGSAGKGDQGPGGAAAGAPGAASGKKGDQGSASDRAKRSRRERRGSKKGKRAGDRRRGGRGGGDAQPPSASRPSPAPKPANPPGGAPRRPSRKGSDGGAGRPPAKKGPGEGRRTPGGNQPRRGGGKQRGRSGGKESRGKGGSTTSAKGSTLRSAVPRR